MSPTTPATLTSPLRVPAVGSLGYIGSQTVKRLPPMGCDVVAFDNLSAGYRDAVPLDRESTPRKKCLLKGGMEIGAEFGLQLAAHGDTILIV